MSIASTNNVFTTWLAGLMAAIHLLAMRQRGTQGFPTNEPSGVRLNMRPLIGA